MDGEDRALKFSISADELAEFAQELNDSINSDSLLKKENKKESPSNTKSKSDCKYYIFILISLTLFNYFSN